MAPEIDSNILSYMGRSFTNFPKLWSDIKNKGPLMQRYINAGGTENLFTNFEATSIAASRQNRYLKKKGLLGKG